jgi:hypothetical protein
VTRRRWLPRFAHWKKRLDAVGRSNRRRRARRSKLDFFERFEQLFAAAGWPRAASDTPREWLDQMLVSASFPWSETSRSETSPALGTTSADSQSAPAAASGDSEVLATRPSREQFAAAATEIVERFYRVRYGSVALEAPERAALDRSLAVISEFLKPAPPVKSARL